MPFGTFASQIVQNPWLLGVILIWTLFWKGIALWRSARLNHSFWFVILLVLNTLGLLEILYLFVFSKHSIQPLKIKPKTKESTKKKTKKK